MIDCSDNIITKILPNHVMKAFQHRAGLPSRQVGKQSGTDPIFNSIIKVSRFDRKHESCHIFVSEEFDGSEYLLRS